MLRSSTPDRRSAGPAPDRPAISQGKSQYNALILSAHRRFSKGFDFLGSYTLSRALSNIGNGVTAAGDISTDAGQAAALPERADLGHQFDDDDQTCPLLDVPRLPATVRVNVSSAAIIDRSIGVPRRRSP